MNDENRIEQQAIPQPVPGIRKETIYTERLKNNYGFFARAGAIYAIVYAICMYKNASGITHPFFVIGSLFFYCLCMKKLEISVKKDKLFYMASIALLAISTFCTDDTRIIVLNQAGIFILVVSFLLHQFYKDENWKFGKYLAAIICTVFGSMGKIARPFQDLNHYNKVRNKKNSKIIYVVIGTVITVPLFLAVWVLLMFADRIFMDMTEKLFDKINIGDIFGVVFSVILMFFAVYCILSYLCEKHLGDEAKEGRRFEPLLGIVVTLPLTLMYVLFSGIQVVYLFMGKGYAADYTYAEYARQGFFQLLFVCILNVVLVLIGKGYFNKSMALKIILTVMSLCTYIMIASSAMRMIVYIQYYFLTFLRLFVLWSLAVLFLLLTGVLISIYRQKFPLFKYSMVVVTVCYILLSFGRPDYWIARCNIGQMEENKESGSENDFFYTEAYEDYAYLSRLSADAAPVLIPYLADKGYDMKLMSQEEQRENFYAYRSDPEGFGYYYMKPLYKSMQEDSIRQFNLSRYMADSYLKKY